MVGLMMLLWVAVEANVDVGEFAEFGWSFVFLNGVVVDGGQFIHVGP